MWSYVGKKQAPRWLWHAIDHRSGQVLAYVLGRRKDEVFLKLKALLEPFGITRYYTDYWGAYQRHLDADEHLSLSRLNHWLPRAQAYPEVVEGTTQFHHEITHALLPQADPIFHN